MTGDIDLLAALLTMSTFSRGLSPNEAQHLVWYGKTALQHPLLDRPSNERRCPSLEPSDPQFEVRVLRETPESQVFEPFDQSKGQVVALVPGQALNCGIGPCPPNGATYLSAKDVMRWSKLAEWLVKYKQRYPSQEVAHTQYEDLEELNSLYFKLSYNPSRAKLPENSLLFHVPDLPGDPSLISDRKLWENAMIFIIRTKVLLTLLVALPLVYGGIHLATWNFHFASQTEHLLWNIACIDIMGTIPLSVIFFVCISRAETSAYRRWSSWEKKNPAMAVLLNYIARILFASMFIFYALSRIYIVVESFISLRHVPIGVYAAIPWVQNIPHI